MYLNYTHFLIEMKTKIFWKVKICLFVFFGLILFILFVFSKRKSCLGFGTEDKNLSFLKRLGL